MVQLQTTESDRGDVTDASPFEVMEPSTLEGVRKRQGDFFTGVLVYETFTAFFV